MTHEPRPDRFERHRTRLFQLAYGMLGSAADAEDVLQDAWLRFDGIADEIDSDAALLRTIVTRLCIDRIRRDRARREAYTGPWLPDPLPAPPDPAWEAERLDALSIGLLLVLERLSPVQRAVFLLREAFSYPYRRIARIVNRSEAHCRQIARRARARVREEKGGEPVHPEAHEALLERFLAAAWHGDMQALEDALTDDSVLLVDGGGEVKAALLPIYGPQKIARYFVGTTAKAPPDAQVRPGRINGQPAAKVYSGGELIAATCVSVRGGRISRVYLYRSPSKLALLSECALPPVDPSGDANN